MCVARVLCENVLSSAGSALMLWSLLLCPALAVAGPGSPGRGGGGRAPALGAARRQGSIPRLRALVAIPARRAPHPRAARAPSRSGLEPSAASLLRKCLLQQQGIVLPQGIPHMARHPTPSRAWCSVPNAPLPQGNGRDVYPQVQANGRVVCLSARCVLVCCCAAGPMNTCTWPVLLCRCLFTVTWGLIGPLHRLKRAAPSVLWVWCRTP